MGPHFWSGLKIDPSSGLDNSVSAAKFVTVEKKEVQSKEEEEEERSAEEEEEEEEEESEDRISN